MIRERGDEIEKSKEQKRRVELRRGEMRERRKQRVVTRREEKVEIEGRNQGSREERKEKEESQEGGIICMLQTILQFFSTSVLTVLYFVKYCSFRASTICMISCL